MERFFIRARAERKENCFLFRSPKHGHAMSLIMTSFILVAAISSLFIFVPTQAQDLSQQIAEKSGYGTSGVTGSSLSETVGRIIRIVLSLVGTIFLMLLVYAGFLWMTAGGEESKIEKAQGIIKAAVIGLIVILMAYSITFFVTTQAFKVTTPGG